MLGMIKVLVLTLLGMIGLVILKIFTILMKIMPFAINGILGLVMKQSKLKQILNQTLRLEDIGMLGLIRLKANGKIGSVIYKKFIIQIVIMLFVTNGMNGSRRKIAQLKLIGVNLKQINLKKLLTGYYQMARGIILLLIG
jgi:uncharacterized membrane protein